MLWKACTFFLFVGVGLGYVAGSWKSGSAPVSVPEPSRDEAVSVPTFAYRVASPTPTTSKPALSVLSTKKQAEGNSSALSEIALLLEHGDIQTALSVLEKRLATEGENSETLSDLAQIHSTYLADDVKAMGYLERALAADPTYEPALVQMMSLANPAKSAQAAAKVPHVLADIAAKNPKSLSVQRIYADHLTRSGRTADAIQTLERATRIPGASNDVRFRLADLYWQSNQPHKAEEQFNGIVRMQEERHRANPTETTARQLELARIDHANALLRAGKKAEAEEILQPISARNPDDLMLQDLLNRSRSSQERAAAD